MQKCRDKQAGAIRLLRHRHTLPVDRSDVSHAPDYIWNHRRACARLVRGSLGRCHRFLSTSQNIHAHVRLHRLTLLAGNEVGQHHRDHCSSSARWRGFCCVGDLAGNPRRLHISQQHSLYACISHHSHSSVSLGIVCLAISDILLHA